LRSDIGETNSTGVVYTPSSDNIVNEPDTASDDEISHFGDMLDSEDREIEAHENAIDAGGLPSAKKFNKRLAMTRHDQNAVLQLITNTPVETFLSAAAIIAELGAAFPQFLILRLLSKEK